MRYVNIHQSPRSQAAAKFKNKTFPLYDLYKTITTGHLAIGTHARAIGQPKADQRPQAKQEEDEDDLTPTLVSDGVDGDNV